MAARSFLSASGDNAPPGEPQFQDAWHSYDRSPWAHPWLTAENLKLTRSFEQEMLKGLVAQHDGTPTNVNRYAFVGNLANNMAMRALPLRRLGYSVDLFLHPQDRYVMSQPGWEMAELTLLDGETDVEHLEGRGVQLPEVPGVFTLPMSADGMHELLAVARKWRWPRPHVPRFVRQRDALLWPGYFCFMPILKALQDYDCLFAAQVPYLAYLANKPYLAAQTGGDLWFEASRNDALGQLQRRSYRKASAILATNPWAYSAARRFGFHNVIYVPLIVDTEAYSPGPRDERQAWQEKVGGNFFALVTARIDRRWKASNVGLEGFCRFAQSHPDARLVLVGWGEDSAADLDELRQREGLDGRIITLPISGKRKMVEYLRSADCLIDQFSFGYYGATALESMSTGLPVIMKIAKNQYDALCRTGCPPVLHAAEASEVSSQLERLAASEDQRRQSSSESRRWVEQNHSAAVWGETYGVLLSAVAAGVKLQFGEAPLASPLSEEEETYHRDMLASAPPFPRYEI